MVSRLSERISDLERQSEAVTGWTLVRTCPDCGERVEIGRRTDCANHPPITADRVILLEFRRST